MPTSHLAPLSRAGARRSRRSWLDQVSYRTLAVTAFGLAALLAPAETSARDDRTRKIERPPLSAAAQNGGAGAVQMAQTQAPADDADDDADTAEDGDGESAPADGPAVELGTIRVQDQGGPNALQEESALDRMPGTIQDTPQTINVITPELIQQQNVTTLDQALRNVPGITTQIGEGGGGMNGDQFRIRGFEAKGDIYVDGLRDFGVYTRDSFNYESIQVLKGPSSESFGMGTTGGAINTVSKTPFLDPMYAGTASGGMGPLGRGTIDLNQPITDTIAVRLNAMVHHSDVVDRDEVGSDRWAVAPSIGFGLGTDTTFTLNYLHQYDDRTPDYGVPVILAPGTTTGKPVTEYGIDRSNWYGFDSDTDETTVDMVTGRLSHQATDWLTLYNDTRVAFYSRFFAPTAASCNAACITALFDGNPATIPTVTRGGPGPFDQESWGAQNISTAVAEFETPGLRHELMAGVDAFYQNDQRDAYAYSPARPTGSLLDPSPSVGGFTTIPSTAATAFRASESSNIALFLSERMWVSEHISILAGVRWDHFTAEMETRSPTSVPIKLKSESDQINPKVSLIIEPDENQTYYFSYATSSNPQGQFVANAPTPIAGATSALEPERNEVFEIGAKVSLLDGRLGLYGSLFRIEKNNAKETDPLTGDIISSGDTQRNQGVEVGITGQPTDEWTITASYTYLDSETLESLTPANVGKEVQYVPHNAVALWTTYDLSSLLPEEFEGITIGGGMTYRDGVYLNAANTSEVPYNLSFDGMIAYQIEQYRFALNGYNLTDRLNYDSLFGNRVIPAAGRTIVFSIGAAF